MLLEAMKNQICRKCHAGFTGAVSSFAISHLLNLEKYKNKYIQIIYSTASTT
jgi:ribosomal protein L31